MRIYADFNGLVKSSRNPDRSGVVLDTYGTAIDLVANGMVLCDGLKFTIYDCSDEQEDLEADVEVFYDWSEEWWLGEIDHKGYRHVPTKHQDEMRSISCPQCSSSYESISSLRGAIYRAGLNVRPRRTPSRQR